jgi:hypothetical protein
VRTLAEAHGGKVEINRETRCADHRHAAAIPLRNELTWRCGQLRNYGDSNYGDSAFN